MSKAKYKSIFAVCTAAIILIFEAVIYFCGTDGGNYISKSIWIANIIGVVLIMTVSIIVDYALEKRLFRQQINGYKQLYFLLYRRGELCSPVFYLL